MQSLCSRPGLTPAGCGDSAEFSGIGVFHESVGCLTAPETAALADAAGVPRRTAERARRNRGIGSEAYLKLCNAVGKDAVSGAPRTVRFMPSAACNWWLLAQRSTLHARAACTGSELRPWKSVSPPQRSLAPRPDKRSLSRASFGLRIICN
jgi:hypothetical protein